MVFTIVFEILVVFFHSANSFQILNGYVEDIPAFRDGSVTIYAKVDSDFWSCQLKQNGAQICQMTWEAISWKSYFEKMSCSSKFNDATYAGNKSFCDCKFVVPNLQENGNKINFFLVQVPITIIYSLYLFCSFVDFGQWSLELTDWYDRNNVITKNFNIYQVEPEDGKHKYGQNFTEKWRNILH
jgi:hypothetical protein